MRNEDGGSTKGERRDRKRRKQREMTVSGAGVRRLQGILRERAEKLKKQEREQDKR